MMKIYTCPPELPEPDFDPVNDGWDHYQELVTEHTAALRQWLIDEGFEGPHTGKIMRSQIADGYAEYMLADGRGSYLIHLRYGDGYDNPDIAFLPKREVVRRIQAQEKLAALFRPKD